MVFDHPSGTPYRSPASHQRRIDNSWMSTKTLSDSWVSPAQATADSPGDYSNTRSGSRRPPDGTSPPSWSKGDRNGLRSYVRITCGHQNPRTMSLCGNLPVPPSVNFLTASVRVSIHRTGRESPFFDPIAVWQGGKILAGHDGVRHFQDTGSEKSGINGG